MAKNSNKKNKKDNKYNAENEIIIGVTTRPKEKVRVENKKSTRTNTKQTQKKINKANDNKKSAAKKNKIKVSKNTKQTNRTNKTININEITKEEKIKKINKKKIIISISILLFIALCGTIYYLTTPVFNISNIEVYGNEKNSEDTYISLSGININETNIFAFTKNSIVKRIKENSYVETVEIKRKLPNILELHITERKVDYQIKNLNSYIYLNNQGYVLEVNQETKDLPIVVGLTSINDNIKVGQRLNNDDLLKLDTILKVVNYCKYNGIESKITSIDVTDISNYTLIFREDGKIAYLGDSSSITEKMTSVAKILKAEEGKEGIIHASEDELKRNRVYFSEQNLEMEE